MLFVVVSVLICACASCLLTGAVRKYAISAEILDHPNSRSSHSVPTPRGGGMAIVATFALAVVALWATGRCPSSLLVVLLGSGLSVALIGFVDDRSTVPARWRFSLHLMAAIGSIWWMDGIPPVSAFGFTVNLGWFGLALATAYMVWMVNLYNFMDGIDGIAGIEAITVVLGGGVCWWLATGSQQWVVPVTLAACVAGFLAWNYPPAKIFMGDAGSGFVGMMIAVLALWSGHHAPQVFWCWFVLLGCFMVDATTTLVRRVRRGEKFNEAHRSHAYQYASRRYRSHKRVTLSIGAINLLWLLPIAVLIATGRLDGVAGTVVAYIPLVWLAFRFKAGVRAEQET